MTTETIGYFLSTGGEHKMYTLRKRYRDSVSGRYGSVFVKNMSTDLDTAITKLIIQCSEDNIPRILEINLEDDLNEIHRKERGQAKAVREAREAKKEQERIQAEEKAEYELVTTVNAGVFTTGKYNGVSYQEAFENDPSYFQMMYGSDYGYTAKVITRLVDMGIITLPTRSTEVVGEVGEKIDVTFTVSCKKVVPSYFHNKTTLILGVADNGAKVKFFTSRDCDSLEVGFKYLAKNCKIKKIEDDIYDMNNVVTTLSTRSEMSEVA